MTECEDVGLVLGLVAHLHDSGVDEEGLVTVGDVCVDLARNE